MSPPVVVRPAPAPATPVPAPVEPQPQQNEMVAFKAALSGLNAVPMAETRAQGELVAVFNRRTGLLRWRLTFSQLSGPVKRGNFHSPAMSDEVAAPVLSMGRNFVSPYEGRAMLTKRQQANLLAGQWYVNLTTERFPTGELRGQMIEQR
ncbi:MAG: CHRD domain-containing protein [Ottowia sp.]